MIHYICHLQTATVSSIDIGRITTQSSFSNISYILVDQVKQPIVIELSSSLSIDIEIYLQEYE
jgi:hypothetical protein